jgi:mono/diheme cytochrome c family protein
MRYPLVLLLIVTFVVVGLAIAAQPGAAQGPTSSEAIAAIYQARCAACHGARGEGTVIAPTLTTSAVQANPAMAQIIAQGSANKRMPAFANVLSQGDIEALTGFIRQVLGAPVPIATEAPVEQPESQPVSLSLNLAPTAGGAVIARAQAQDQDGQPVVGTVVQFRLRTALGGVLPLALATTDAQGQAEARLQLGEGRQVTLEAALEGNEGQQGLASATAAAGRAAIASAPSGQKSLGPAIAYTSLQIPGLLQLEPLGTGLTSPTPPVALVAFLGVLVGGVWITYGYVLYQVYRIGQASRASPR